MTEIESLFELGVLNIVFGKNEARFFAQAKQGISTGEVGHYAAIEHQAAGETVDECIEKIKRQCHNAKEALHKETYIVVPRSN